MKHDAKSTHFTVWPFRAEPAREDGEKNNGGLDLIEDPALLDHIHEATEANGLRQMLQFLNRPNGDFRTLGCASGLDEDGLYYSYIELTLRESDLARAASWPHQFERKWLDWLDRVECQVPGLGHLLRESTAMDYREFSLRESAPQLLISIVSRSPAETRHRQYCSYLLRFFQLLENGEIS